MKFHRKTFLQQTVLVSACSITALLAVIVHADKPLHEASPSPQAVREKNASTDTEPVNSSASTELEIRRLQTQLNILETRIQNPVTLEQRRVIQDQLFKKIQTLHTSRRGEPDTQVERKPAASKASRKIEARSTDRESSDSHATEAPQDSNPPSAPIKSESAIARPSPVAPLKVNSPETRDPSTEQAKPDDPMDIYRDIISYGQKNSAAKTNSAPQPESQPEQPQSPANP
jgi:TolA-binding protein